MQLVADRVDPIGETRADMRAAAFFKQLGLLIAPEGFDLDAMAEQVRNYLEINQPQEERTMFPDELPGKEG